IPNLTGSSMNPTAHANSPRCTNLVSATCSLVTGMWERSLSATASPGTLRPPPAGRCPGAARLASPCTPSARTETSKQSLFHWEQGHEIEKTLKRRGTEVTEDTKIFWMIQILKIF